MFVALPARADHLFEAAIVDPPLFILPAPAGGRIGLLGACLGLVTEITRTEDTGFFVAHGWFVPFWNATSSLEKRAFSSSATFFVLLIDGVAQPSALHAALVNNPDGLYNFRLWVTENHNGLEGDHVFTGQWFYDASDPSIGGAFGTSVLLQECSLTVHFVA